MKNKNIFDPNFGLTGGVHMTLFTFSELSEPTARGLWIVRMMGIMISPSWAQNLSIHSDVEIGKFTVIHPEVSAEVVQTISTKGNCEDPCCRVIPEKYGHSLLCRRMGIPWYNPNAMQACNSYPYTNWEKPMVSKYLKGRTRGIRWTITPPKQI